MVHNMARVSLKNKVLIFVLVAVLILVGVLFLISLNLNKSKIHVNTIQLNPNNIENISNNFYLINDSFAYSNLTHWAHMPLTYNINSNCGARADKIEQAFSEIEKETKGVVDFERYSIGNDGIDIDVSCSQKPADEKDAERETLGEALKSVYSANESIIYNASIVFYPSLESCGYFPFLEVHEILHTFGYDHSEDKQSIMYYSTDYCLERYENEDIYGKPRIDDEIVKNLIDIYGK